MPCDFFSIEAIYYVVILAFLNSLTQFTFLRLQPHVQDGLGQNC